MNPAPRILVITTPYFPPSGGGLERYAYEMAMRLHRNHGYRIVVITSGEYRGEDVKEEMDGLIVYRLSYQFKFSNTPFSFGWSKKIKRILKSENPDIINIQMPVPGIGDITALAARKCPLVVTYHAGSMHKGKLIPDIIIWFYESGPLKWLLRRANRIICSSNYVRNDFLRDYHDKSVTITPGVDVNLFKPPAHRNTDGRALIFVAGLGYAERHKGLTMLIDALRMLLGKIADLRLTVVGDGDMRAEYEKYVEGLNLEKAVTFAGRLTGTTLAETYQKSNLLVLPSLAPAESFGMVLIEAMATGLPVIGSNVGGIPSAIDDHVDGLLVPPGDLNALYKAIEEILGTPGLEEKMGEAGLAKVKKQFPWDVLSEKYYATLENL